MPNSLSTIAWNIFGHIYPQNDSRNTLGSCSYLEKKQKELLGNLFLKFYTSLLLMDKADIKEFLNQWTDSSFLLINTQNIYLTLIKTMTSKHNHFWWGRHVLGFINTHLTTDA